MTIHAPSRSHADQAFTALAAGEPVIVADDREGHLVFAAALATPALLAFTVRHTSGFVRVAMTAEDCRRLDLPPMYYRGDPAQRVTVDRRGPGTGISGADRARTIAALAAPDSVADDFTRPGHVVPVQAYAGAIPGIAETAIELVRRSGRSASAVYSTLVSAEDPSRMASGSELRRFATEHGLVLVPTGPETRAR
ncbi:3,4-dihydroxy-2-butanone-4-phosphate synthase [Amycolatopsis sp. RTGN1]|uniref:3,4-dihydroxy-2-butanone-4-phosphate synthase n=1 Tax=Amycolatopsis ponsaeliensis TaxID=2992142 RepID=UPI00255008D5|nr:3,4-dihydroxy-2-butanone-4-phosphate synthase [Amycolatopsis sp. RTGN1]